MDCRSDRDGRGGVGGGSVGWVARLLVDEWDIGKLLSDRPFVLWVDRRRAGGLVPGCYWIMFVDGLGGLLDIW